MLLYGQLFLLMSVFAQLLVEMFAQCAAEVRMQGCTLCPENATVSYEKGCDSLEHATVSFDKGCGPLSY